MCFFLTPFLGWIRFNSSQKAATIIEAARLAFDELLQMKIDNVELDISTTDLIKEVISIVKRK